MKFISLIFFCVIFAVGVWAEDTPKSFSVGKYTVQVGGPTIKTYLRANNGDEQLISEKRVSGVDLRASFKSTKTAEGITLEWQGKAKNLTVKFSSLRIDECLTSYSSYDPESETEDCYPYGDDIWYGGPERRLQEWPVQIATIKNEPFVTRETNNQAVLEPYWVNTAGHYIYVDPNTPLFFDSNNRASNSLCLISALRDPYVKRPELITQITYCSMDDVVTAHLDGLKTYLGIPRAHPSPYLMQTPIYSTWVRYQRDINQEVVKNFTDEIFDNGFLPGQIDIDDRWETCYGSLTFDTTRFPNITQLTDYIHSKGATASLWVHPFVNVGCDGLYQQYKDEGRLVTNQNGNVASVWWNGAGAVIDISNKTTKDWWIGCLLDLKQRSGLDGYKLDAGETSWLPQLPNITGDPQYYPESFVRDFVKAAAELGSNLEIRVGRSTQDIPAYIRMIDKDTRWGLDNGLQSVITTSFQMGIVGYPFILPDMIGGNQYGETITKELFIRWLEASALLPAIQFSVVPWDFDDETVEISRKFVKLHRDYSELLLAASEDTINDGRPLIAPLWWHSPKDSQTFSINDQYMVGEGLLVAPVLTEGTVQRDIYIPDGVWQDLNNGGNVAGPDWLRNYSAPLDILPLFRKN